LSSAKVRPAIVVGAFKSSPDHLIVPLTSRMSPLVDGEFVLADWRGAGLNLPSAVKRGLYMIHSGLVIKSVGRLATADFDGVKRALRLWLEF
jgi:mRNA interferase MazF